jgi:transmembrane sensor
MSAGSRLQLNHQISDEAAQWLVEFRTCDIDAEGRYAFDTWVRASPEHLRAFVEVAVLWEQAGGVDANRTFDLDALIARARTEADVAILGRVPSRTVTGTRHRELRPRAYWVAAAAATLFAAIGLFAWLRFDSQPTYSADVGEQRSMRLSDGSTVTLNSKSKLRVRFTNTQRTVELLQGEALFHVAKNAARPFVVRSGDTSVRAVGTQFDVNKGRESTIVTVVEGKVAVLADAPEGALQSVPMEAPTNPADPSGGDAIVRPAGSMRAPHGTHSPIFLSAGEKLEVVPGVAPQPTKANLSTATAWTQGQLVLESASLTEVAEQFNRYSARKLVVEDHGQHPLHLSGVFATDPDFLLRYLQSRPDILVHETPTEIRITRK